MQFHTLKRTHTNKRSQSVGRGGKRGKTAGRGTKGQNARAGRKKRPELRDIIKKIPKLRGYRFASISVKPASVSLSMIERSFSSGETVSPDTLKSKGVLSARKMKGGVKLIGNEIKVNVAVVGCNVSKGAKDAITKAGGSVS